MVDTIVEYAKLSDEEQQRQRNFYDEIKKHDEATALGSARREGKVEGKIEERNTLAMKMRQKGYTEEQIKELLGDDYNG